MTLPDLVNGCLEGLGAVAVWMNVWKIREHKAVRGVSLFACVFFTVWGGWNLYYYPALGQWFSACAGIGVFVGNLVFTYYVMRYQNDETDPRN